MPSPPYRPARVEIAIYKPSGGGLYWGRYPNGDKPGGLAGAASVVSAVAAALTTKIKLAGALSLAAAASGILAGGVGPGVPDTVRVFNQGGLHVDTAPSQNECSLSWNPAPAGGFPVAGYLIGRNGVDSYATVTAPVVVTGFISGTTLTVQSVTGGVVMPGMRLPGALQGTAISSLQGGASGGAGNYTVNRSQFLGSSGAPVTFTLWCFRDTVATSVIITNVASPATIYGYTVTAIDTAGNRGTPVAPSLYIFEGVANIDTGADNLSYGGVTVNFTDTSASPQTGSAFDMLVHYPGGGGFQIGSGPPAGPGANGFPNTVEVGAMKYFTVDVKFLDNAWVGNALNLKTLTRLPPGDVSPRIQVALQSYATPMLNGWVRFKIPLADIRFGVTHFHGSLTGTTATVSSILDGPGIDAGGFMFGGTWPANCYVATPGSGDTGNFGVGGASGTAPVGDYTYQRSSWYKTGFQFNTDTAASYAVDNYGFTP